MICPACERAELDDRNICPKCHVGVPSGASLTNRVETPRHYGKRRQDQSERTSFADYGATKEDKQ